jgi:hypothetical protein
MSSTLETDLAKSKKSSNLIEIGKKDSVSSQNSEGGYSICSELNPTERELGLGSFIKLPLFEVAKTMQYLLHLKYELLKQIKTANSKSEDSSRYINNSRRVPKSCSMMEEKGICIEDFAADVSPEVYQFLKKVYSYKSNYLFHVLNMRNIYFQYVSVSRSTMSFTNTQEFLVLVEKAMLQNKNYMKDLKLYQGKV